MAFFSRSPFFTPCSSSPKAMLCSTERWGSNPKCWNTIASSFLRICSNSCLEAFEMSVSLIMISPEVGRIRRFIQRSKVDFPLPDSPMITNISPSLIERLASFTATVHPVAFNISSLVLPSFSIFSALCFSFPKIRYRFLISILLIIILFILTNGSGLRFIFRPGRFI